MLETFVVPDDREGQKLRERNARALRSTFSRIAGSGSMRSISVAPIMVEKIAQKARSFIHGSPARHKRQHLVFVVHEFRTDRLGDVCHSHIDEENSRAAVDCGGGVYWHDSPRKPSMSVRRLSLILVPNSNFLGLWTGILFGSYLVSRLRCLARPLGLSSQCLQTLLSTGSHALIGRVAFDRPPKLDGTLDDPPWQEATPTPESAAHPSSRQQAGSNPLGSSKPGRNGSLVEFNAHDYRIVGDN